MYQTMTPFKRGVIKSMKAFIGEAFSFNKSLRPLFLTILLVIFTAFFYDLYGFVPATNFILAITILGLILSI